MQATGPVLWCTQVGGYPLGWPEVASLLGRRRGCGNASADLSLWGLAEISYDLEPLQEQAHPCSGQRVAYTVVSCMMDSSQLVA